MSTQGDAKASERPLMTLQQAIEEAERCLLCHDAPCSQACPGGTDPGKFIRQIRFFNFKGAARTVLGNNPLGGVCTYVCPTEDTCVGACLRSGLDRPIDIDGLQRFAAEYARQVGLKTMSKGEETRPERVAVVGAGPAGLTAAAMLAQYGYPTTLIEARDKVGGMLRYGVPASRLSDEDLDADVNEILELGVEIRSNMRIEGEDAIQALLDKGFAAVFMAPGLWKPYALTMPGHDLDGVSTALTFLEASRSDTDKAAAMVKDRAVAVIGGGSVAMDLAHVSKQLGATRIYCIALESMTELPANERELSLSREDGVVIKPQCLVTEILGQDGKVTGAKGVETEWIEPGKLVPSNARPIDGTSFQLKVGAVIQAIGQGVTEAVGGVVAAATSEGGLVNADEGTQATSIAKVYAGGDIVRGAGTVIAAVGDGKRAADAIHELLSGAKEVTS